MNPLKVLDLFNQIPEKVNTYVCCFFFQFIHPLVLASHPIPSLPIPFNTISSRSYQKQTTTPPSLPPSHASHPINLFIHMSNKPLSERACSQFLALFSIGLSTPNASCWVKPSSRLNTHTCPRPPCLYQTFCCERPCKWKVSRLMKLSNSFSAFSGFVHYL